MSSYQRMLDPAEFDVLSTSLTDHLVLLNLVSEIGPIIIIIIIVIMG